ncbi:hypothetical protein EO98_15135 [Methanosarcina sp. 2.H.T.1A.6]|uniref:hypothetical protein n=1 Tax=unclassified Methanosarcina TaxID=2644672 RepID=UPI000622362C|nr:MULTISPECIES: hypothetical protein [unclassified Methanosarcina]KKG15881.1 hypothetical protein EO97_14245 [Methanosarcina sp. 2.H.T.1A.15]KKG16701.1 hypothetical protein EO94_00515 [Methanosarcina sp. 2.H.T.1A.3]KKG22840.1 hypothetical protein EO98_15135 [Methanosarcina sp. 2.H.T.1A.6]KKG24430.1 hypothetical protein EO96_14730 [Methanosarcina sp. 2.H.T.1A.8]
MEEGKIKNTITRSFELQDYRIEGAELSGFWADLLSKEELTVEVNYRPENKKTFSPGETETLIHKICRKCDSFEAQLPENTKCEVTFKDFGEKVYKTDQLDFEPVSREMDEVKVAYRFYVAYYV